MKYRILRGTRQIGGSVTEIVSDKGSRIWIDFGTELPGEYSDASDREMVERMNNRETGPDAVFFTHIHGDHTGLLAAIPDRVHIFIGQLSKRMMENGIDVLLCRVKMDREREKLVRERALLNSDRVHFYKAGPDEWRDIRFTALGTDHSVADSYMLRFEIDGEVLVHTGDFREHGRMGKEFMDSMKTVFGDRPVDVLVTEGTMLNRSPSHILTEQEMQKEATDILRKNPYAFLICSSTNMDSLASFYWATVFSTKRKRAFYCNSYVKRQLDLFTECIGEQENKWQYRFHRCYRITPNLDGEFGGKTQYEWMLQNGFTMMVGTGKHYRDLMNRFILNPSGKKPVLIYSLWNGYLDENSPCANRELIDLIHDWGEENVCCLHTGGHAPVKTLLKVIEILKPRKAIVPVHTENAGGLRDAIKDEKLKALVKTDEVRKEGSPCCFTD